MKTAALWSRVSGGGGEGRAPPQSRRFHSCASSRPHTLSTWKYQVRREVVKSGDFSVDPNFVTKRGFGLLTFHMGIKPPPCDCSAD